MRTFRWLILAVLLLLWLVAEATSPANAIEDMSGKWRRTGDGWQRVEFFRPPVQYRRPALHPAVVGSLEALLAMTAMLALSKPDHSRTVGLASAKSRRIIR